MCWETAVTTNCGSSQRSFWWSTSSVTAVTNAYIDVTHLTELMIYQFMCCCNSEHRLQDQQNAPEYLLLGWIIWTPNRSKTLITTLKQKRRGELDTRRTKQERGKTGPFLFKCFHPPVATITHRDVVIIHIFHLKWFSWCRKRKALYKK